MSKLVLSKYHKIVLFWYVSIVFSVFISASEIIDYTFLVDKFSALILIVTIILFIIYILYSRQVKLSNLKIKPSALIVIVIYSFAFAIPEEILFRGLIQDGLEKYFSPLWAILFSSFVFGVAHIFNGINSFKVKELNWKLAGITSIAGMPLGATFLLTNSLLLPTFLHALFLIVLQIFPKKD